MGFLFDDYEDLELAEARVEMARLAWGRPDSTYRQIFVAELDAFLLPMATPSDDAALASDVHRLGS